MASDPQESVKAELFAFVERGAAEARTKAAEYDAAWREAERQQELLAKLSDRADAMVKGWEALVVEFGGSPESALRQHRLDWADWLETWDGSVGPEPPTVEAVIAWLRADRLPFGMAANHE